MYITVIATGCGEQAVTKANAGKLFANKPVAEQPAVETGAGMPEDEFSDIMNIVNNNNKKPNTPPANSFNTFNNFSF